MYQAQNQKEENPTLRHGNNHEPIETGIDMAAKVYKKEYSYQVYFLEQWYTFGTEKQAQERANELNYEYYSKHKDRLPKGITIDHTNKRFRFHIRLNNEIVKHIKSSKDLNKVIEVRNHILKNLLDLF